MLYYLTAAGLVAHTFFWGLGLAGLLVPREWRPWAWVFAPGCGWALQSAVVWAGAHSPLAGTAAYAWASEAIPLALLLAALWLRRLGRPRGWLVVLPAAVVTAWLLLSPMAAAGRGLTASSLGSCDQADYAAGARVFQEFAHGDRTGFLGLPEVTRVRSADYFFDFWLRLNHFTPSALLAHNATVFGVEAWRLVSVSAAALVLLNLPIVFFLARVLVGTKGLLLAGLVALYAWSPLNAYGVHHGALGQLYAAQGIALLTLAITGAARATWAGRPGRRFLPLMIAAIWLLAGSYNFILLVCLAPAGAWLLFQGLRRKEGRFIGRVLGVVGAAAVACVVLFWGRFDGLVERFSLFEQYDFGWTVPLASPEGWLGVVRDTALEPWPPAIRWSLASVAVVLFGAGLLRLARGRPDRSLAAFALVVPVVAGWGLLAWESRERANASYDAYKILAVFLPGLLAGLTCWLAGFRRQTAAAFLAVLLAANLAVARQFREQMATPPLRVDHRLAAVAQLEAEPRVASLNMTVTDFWSRLWANAFLLRKPQYFVTHSYEGRLNTALKGEWDLQDTVLRNAPFDPADRIVASEQFQAVRVGAAGRMAIAWAGGWHPEERSGSDHWRWSNGTGSVVVTNPSHHVTRARLVLKVRALAAGPLELRLEGWSAATKQLDGTPQEVIFEDLRFPPGDTVVAFLGAPGIAPGGGDPRPLSFALYGFELQSLPPPAKTLP